MSLFSMPASHLPLRGSALYRSRRHWLCAFALAVWPFPTVAQMVQPIPGVTSNDPVDMLSMHLRTLSANPRNLSALLGAGQSAIDVGDPNAAVGFFARAEEIDPRSGAAKAGLGSALTLLEKPEDALRVFGEAVSLGVSERVIAKDRGLAYDLRGDNRRAQRDYATVLRDGTDDEVIRRYALSLGISGDRSQALAMLDPLLRRQDQGAWRARAFIMAMNNDVSGANAIARQVMPVSLASTMSPFLARLAKLNPAERAHAVNFGTIPSDGQSFAAVQTDDSFRPADSGKRVRSAADALIPAGAPLGRVTLAAAAKPSPPVPSAPAPGSTAATVRNSSMRVGTRIDTRIAAIDPAKLPPEARGDFAGSPGKVVRVTSMTSLPAPDPVAPVPPRPVARPETLTSPLPPPPPVETDAGIARRTPVVIGPPADAAPGTAPVPVHEVAAKPVKAPAQNRLASILSGLQTEEESVPVALPTIAEVRAAQRAAARKTAAAAAAAAAEQEARDEKAKSAAAAKASPARLWVQVATGSNARGLDSTWQKIRGANADLFKSYGGYSVAYKATNRILAGPVRSAAAARALITALGKAGVSATTYSSEAGQEVVKIGSK